MITAYAEQLGGSDNSVDALLNKPFHLEDLRRAMAELLPELKKESGHRAGDRSTTQSGNSPPCRVAVLHRPFFAQNGRTRYGVNTPYAEE